jgi:hypothetical protein
MVIAFIHNRRAKKNAPTRGTFVGARALMTPFGDEEITLANVRFSNRPVEVKRFQTIHDCGVDITRGLALLGVSAPRRRPVIAPDQ